MPQNRKSHSWLSAEWRVTPWAIFVSILAIFLSYFGTHVEVWEYFGVGSRYMAINAIAASVPVVPSNFMDLFVPRVDYARAVKAFIERDVEREPGYMVVVGPRGCGKSTVVVDALRNRTGTLLTRFGSNSQLTQIFESLLSPHVSERFRVTTENAVRDLFLDVQRVHYPDQPTWRPTIVAEIDRGITDDVIVEVSKAMKRIGADLGAAHVILVLSDANAAFALPDDPDRQNVLWVEDLSKAEAHELLDRRDCFVRAVNENGSVIVGDKNAALRAHLFQSLGTRASTLVQAAVQSRDEHTCNEAKLRAFIKDRVAMARSTVTRLVTLPGDAPKATGAAFTRLIRALLNTTDDVGVSEEDVNEYLVAPSRAARIFKEFHAVMYHLPSRTYRFHSVAHRRAAEQLLADARLNNK